MSFLKKHRSGRPGSSARCSASSAGLLAGALAALAPGTAAAGVVEFRSTLNTSQTYNSNVTSTEHDEVSDQVTSLAPDLSIRARSERGSLGASGGLRARKYWEVDALDAVDRILTADGDYWITPRLQLLSQASNTYYENTDSYQDDGTVLLEGAPDLTASAVGGALRYLVTPRTAITLTPSFANWDYGDPEVRDGRPRTDSSTRNLALGFERNLSIRDSIGFDVSAGESTFEQPAGQPDTDSTSRQLRLRWRRVWSPIWSSSLWAGAARVRQDVGEVTFEPLPGQIPPDVDIDDTALSGVGELSLERQTPWTTLSLRASQSVSPSSGFGTDLTVLTLSGRLDWRFAKRWTFSAGASWSDSSQTTDTIVLTTPVGSLGADSRQEGQVISQWITPACTAGSSALFTGIDRLAAIIADENGNALFFVDRGTGCFGLSDSAFEYQQAIFDAALSWRMTRRFSTILRWRFVQQTAGAETGLDEYNATLVSLGFTYHYDVDLY